MNFHALGHVHELSQVPCDKSLVVLTERANMVSQSGQDKWQPLILISASL